MLDKSVLFRFYWEKGLSLEKIAVELGVSTGFVWKEMKRYGIARRVNERNKFEAARSVPLSGRQLDIVVGSVLGDGYLECGSGRGVRLRIKHSLAQEEYLDYKKRELPQLFQAPPRFIEQFRFGRALFAKEYVGIAHPGLSKVYEAFYLAKMKYVPDNIASLLSPLVVAIWYMDDGTFSINKSAHTLRFCTHCFSQEENNLLAAALKERFSIEMHVHRCRDKFVLQSGCWATKDKLFSLIEPYVGQFLLSCKGKPSETTRQTSSFDEDIVRPS